MKAPAQASDVTKEWIQYMLTDYEKKENPGATVVVDTFETSKGSNVGEGYVGAILKLHVKAKVSEHSVNSNAMDKVYNLAIKFKGDDTRIQFMFEEAQVYIKELLMYSEVLKEFDQFQKEHTNNDYPISIPKFVYGKCTDDEFVLAMENIKDNRFTLHSKETLNFQHLKLAVTQLVRLHSVSYSYNQSFPFLMEHPEFVISDYVKLFQKFFNSSIIDIVCEILTKEENEDLAQKIKSKKENLVKQSIEILNENEHKLLCLVHGDAHANNIMFKYKEGDENLENPIDIKLLDWQIAHWNTPLIDLHYLIYSSTSRDFRKKHLEDILKYYHSTFIQSASDMGVKVLNWSYEDFKNEFNRMALYGFLRGIHLSFIHHCPGFIKVAEEEKQQAINAPYIVKILLTPLAKLFQYYFLSSTVDSMMNYSFTKSILPFIKEITTRENENLASRILGLVYEADENGLFD